MPIAAKHRVDLDWIKALLQKRFGIKDTKLKLLLGSRIARGRLKKQLTISQKHYVE
ncbi:hypothetical protein Cpir12675_002349, partial [Ceratocystis pirilliformis]